MNYSTTSVEELIAESRSVAASPGPLPDEFTRDRVQLGRLSITHEAVMDWLLCNPGRGQMRDCAEHFGFTRAWLSSMVWSDAFQAKLADKKEELFAASVIPVREQINGIALRAMDRLAEKIEETEDGKFLLDTADKMLHKLGYAPKVDLAPGVTSNTQNNYYGVDAGLLAQARENAKKGGGTPSLKALGKAPHEVINVPKPSGTEPAVLSPEGIQNIAEDNLGEAS